MIERTIGFLAKQLDVYLSARLPGERHVVLAAPAAADAAAAAETARKVLVSLVNIERETAAANSSQRVHQDGSAAVRVAPPLNLNLTLLICANYEDNYPDSLKMLSLVVRFFQAHPLFTPQAAPDLPEPLTRLAIEWCDMDLQAMNNLWSVMGGRQLPSVLYKVRMLIVEDAWLGDDLPVITATNVDSVSR